MLIRCSLTETNTSRQFKISVNRPDWGGNFGRRVGYLDFSNKTLERIPSLDCALHVNIQLQNVTKACQKCQSPRFPSVPQDRRSPAQANSALSPLPHRSNPPKPNQHRPPNSPVHRSNHEPPNSSRHPPTDHVRERVRRTPHHALVERRAPEDEARVRDRHTALVAEADFEIAGSGGCCY